MKPASKWKPRLRDAMAKVARGSGRLAAAERANHDSLTVLCYHRILPPIQRAAYHDPDLVVTPEVFNLHCKIMAERFTVQPLEVALMRWGAGERPRRPLAAITFDDGYRDNLRYAVPILDQHELRATFFVIAGLMDTDRVPWYDAAGAAWRSLEHTGDAPHGPANVKEAVAAAKHMGPAQRMQWVTQLVAAAGYLPFEEEDLIMTSAQVRELADAGHEIGSHSMTHPLLPQCDGDTLRREVAESRARLVAVSGQTVRGLCYPNGDYDVRVHQMAVQSGYTYAASMESGVNNPFSFDTLAVRRCFIHQERLANSNGKPCSTLFRMELCGLSQRWFRRGAA